ncbi:MAG: hypothetical protein GF334_01055 [Candidatus Altiarchaeales archaeon]|nr:hypothetical protein [Candidatus Altiarchaeales archaeon]
MFKYLIKAQEKKAATILKHKRLFAIMDLIKVAAALIRFGTQLNKMGIFEPIKEMWYEGVSKIEKRVRDRDSRYRSWETDVFEDETSTGMEEDD